ncbi:MAG: alpha-glucan family phosphorylase [Candidatus Nanosalina sp.]
MPRQISYFSMEIGVEPEIKTYSGGLGVLAGDTVEAAADHDLDFTAVTLLYRDGFFRQEVNDGEQEEFPQGWNYREILEDTGERISLQLRGREVEAKIWSYEVSGEKGNATVLFLDTGLDANEKEDRKITSQLYMGGRETRLCQEAVLGIGGTRALEKLGIETDYYHMNEGHSALLTTEAEGEKVFTTHTPVPAGHDTFEQETVEKVLPEEKYSELDYDEKLNMTEVALENSNYCNAVSDRHAEISKKMFPEHKFDAVTNGVHSATWTSKEFSELFDEHVQKWRLDPPRLTKAAGIEDSKIWKAKKKSKKRLFKYLEDKNGKDIDEETFTVGYARRSTAYKRPILIFRDLDQLEELAEKHGGLQLIFGGKAHPEDKKGKELISKIFKFSEMLEEVDVYFIEDYGMEDALKMVSGVDLWLNNPERGEEACGTSGMKAAHNATPQLSTPDGWWLEGKIDGVTGWTIGDDYVEGENEDRIDSQSIYRKLDEILSIYHNDRKRWIEIMKNCITLNASHFNTDRMLKEYLARAYK